MPNKITLEQKQTHNNTNGMGRGQKDRKNAGKSARRLKKKTEKKEQEISRGGELICSLGEDVRQGSSVGIVTRVPYRQPNNHGSNPDSIDIFVSSSKRS